MTLGSLGCGRSTRNQMPRDTGASDTISGSLEEAAQLGARASAFERLALGASDEEEAPERVLRTLVRVAGGVAAVAELNGSAVLSVSQETDWETDASGVETIERVVYVNDAPSGILRVRAQRPDPALTEFASVLLGGVFARYRTKLSDRRRLADQVLHDVLLAALPDDVVVRRLDSFGITFDTANQVLIGSVANAEPSVFYPVPRGVGMILREARDSTLRGVVGDEAVIVVPDGSARPAADVLYSGLTADGARASVGVGGAYPDPIGLRVSYAEARVAAQSGRGVQMGAPLFLAGFVRIEEPEDVVMELADHALLPLFSAEELSTGRRDERAGLVTTLEVFLASDCSHVRTAERLGVHPNTVRYRIRRMEQLSGLDLSSFQTRAHLWLALAAARHSSRLPASGRGFLEFDE